MDFVDQQYIPLISNHLPLFTRVSDTCWNFRCVFCGDSKRKKSKKRGYIYFRNGKFRYFCHNCGEPCSLGTLIERLDPTLFKQYKLDKFRAANNVSVPEQNILPPTPKPTYHFEINKKLITKLSSLHHDHPAKRYIDQREIPSRFHYKLYYTPTFNKFVNSIIPQKLSEDFDQARIVIPFIDQNKRVFGFQGRSLSTSEETLRYITIMLDPDMPKIYGLDDFDIKKHCYIVEGPFDSMFLPNCLASGGSDLANLGNYIDIDNSTFVFDNEPRNQEIHKKLQHVIEKKYKVCIWPQNLLDKDINDIHLRGQNPQIIIDENTYQGPLAMAKFTFWKKV